MQADLILAHRHCNNNREEIARSAVCGCFYCGESFQPGEIDRWVDWVDKDDGLGVTALCPRCGIDAVIGAASDYPLTADFLAAMHRRWF